MFSLYNRLVAKILIQFYFERNQGKIGSSIYSVIGVPFLTISLLFKFGNYATD